MKAHRLTVLAAAAAIAAVPMLVSFMRPTSVAGPGTFVSGVRVEYRTFGSLAQNQFSSRCTAFLTNRGASGDVVVHRAIVFGAGGRTDVQAVEVFQPPIVIPPLGEHRIEVSGNLNGLVLQTGPNQNGARTLALEWEGSAGNLVLRARHMDKLTNDYDRTAYVEQGFLIE